MSTIELSERHQALRHASPRCATSTSRSRAGEVVCLLGPSGCGKTTTLRMIAGLEQATEGDVIIAGQRMNDLPPEKRDIAMVFQFYALYPALTVGENLAFPLHAEGISRRRARRAASTRVAETLQLTDVLDRLPGQIAEGEKQRVAVGPRHRPRSQLLPVRRAAVAPRRRAAPDRCAARSRRC